jgi:hypothetical protein
MRSDIFSAARCFSKMNGKNSSITRVRSYILKWIAIKLTPTRPFIFLSILALIYTLTAYRGNVLTIGGDDLIPFHATAYISRLFNSSNIWNGFGAPLPPIFSLLPLPDMALFSLFSKMGINIYLANKLYVFVLATVSSFSIYYLVTTIFRKNSLRVLIGFVAVIVYLYNPWMYVDTFKSMIFIELTLVQSGLILFLAFVIKYFQTSKIKYSLYAGLSAFLMLSYPGVSAYRILFLALCAFFFIAIYYLFCNYQVVKLKSACVVIIKGIVIVGATSFCLNAYWIIPFVQFSGLYSSFASAFQITNAFNATSNALNTLRLLNSWSFYAGYAPYAPVYFSDTLLIIASFAWPIFAFSPLLFRESVKKKTLALYFVTLITILLAIGPNLFGNYYTNLVNIHLGQFYFLRPFYNTAIFSELVLTLEFSILIGLLSSLIFSLIMRKKCFDIKTRKIIAILGITVLCLILIFSSWPIPTGQVMRNWYSPSQYGVQIPDRYWTANNYLEQVAGVNYRTLLLPSTSTYVGTTWGFQGTSQFYNLMFNVPLVTGNEVPYLSSDKISLAQVYLQYYEISNANDITNLVNHANEIIAFQNDVVQVNRSLTINFGQNNYREGWHQVELMLPFSLDWSNFSYIELQFTGNLNISLLQLGAQNSTGNIGWWYAQNHIYQNNNGTLLQTTESSMISNSSLLLLPLGEPDLNPFIGNISSIWIKYFIENSSQNASLTINKIQLVNASLDGKYYASILAQNNIKYLLIDQSINSGATDSSDQWISLLNSSQYFKQVWREDTLYIYENLIN